MDNEEILRIYLYIFGLLAIFVIPIGSFIFGIQFYGLLEIFLPK